MWLSALGLALVLGGLVVPQVVDGPWFGDAEQSGQAQLTEGVGTSLPFVTAPSVRFSPVAKKPSGVRKQKLQPSPTRPSAARGQPHRLVVPKLGINAPVVNIHVSGGVLDPPADPKTLGWWAAGAKPGARLGGALITGHTVSTGGGAFDDLETLRAGDKVRVRTAKGAVRYRVTAVTIYRKASLARDAARVFSQSVPGRLVLVTCEEWNGSIYLSNAVVLAEPI